MSTPHDSDRVPHEDVPPTTDEDGQPLPDPETGVGAEPIELPDAP